MSTHIKAGQGILYLIPTLLGPTNIEYSIPPGNLAIIRDLKYFAIEQEKSARSFLKKIGSNILQEDFEFTEISEHTSVEEVYQCIMLIKSGINMGLITDAGAPGIADPGAELVKFAHENQIKVVPMVGPSSILLALMAAGMNGQRFRFIGYLPRDSKDRVKAIKELEKESFKNNETQVFIETPYRNKQMMEDLLVACHPDTLIGISCDLTLSTEYILTQSTAKWKNGRLPDLHKRPAVFLLLRN